MLPLVCCIVKSNRWVMREAKGTFLPDVKLPQCPTMVRHSTLVCMDPRAGAKVFISLRHKRLMKMLQEMVIRANWLGHSPDTGFGSWLFNFIKYYRENFYERIQIAATVSAWYRYSIPSDRRRRPE